MARSNDDTMDDAFDDGADLLPDDLVLLVTQDGVHHELVVLAEVVIDRIFYAVLATRDQVEQELDGELMLAALDPGPSPRRVRPIQDDSVIAAVRTALSDLVDFDEVTVIAEA